MEEDDKELNLDDLEFEICEKKVDISFFYKNEDIEAPSESELLRLPPVVRRNVLNAQQYIKRTPLNELLNREPVMAPLPSIPDPYDDNRIWGYRDKYLFRPKLKPRVKGEPKKRKSGKRQASARPEEADVEADGPAAAKRQRLTQNDNETQEEEGPVHLYNHGLPTPEPSPGFRRSCDRPMTSIEDHGNEERNVLNFLPGANNNIVAFRATIPDAPPSVSEIVAPTTSSNRAKSVSRRLKTKFSNPKVRTSARPVAVPDPGPPQFSTHGILAWPLEVRRQLYRALLVRDEPIRVHAS